MRIFRFLLFAVLALCGGRTSHAVPVMLAAGGMARVPVTIGGKASDEVKACANALAEYLGKITGAKFAVVEGDGRSGLAVGLPGDFPALALASQFAPTDMARGEEYILKSHAAGAWLIGATPKAVQDAVWDFLYRLGYRRFFPGVDWEIVPRIAAPSIDIDTRQKPAYYNRNIVRYTYGTWKENKPDNDAWVQRNRAGGAFELNTGHSYGGIISHNWKEFEAHPEYFALVNGKRNVTEQGKFCVSNPGLRKLVIDAKIAEMEADPERSSVSLDPSDGSGHCECPECARLGTVTDRVLLLANLTAQALNDKFAAKYGPKYVGIYAYNQHCPPPVKVTVDPHVIVSIATAFLQGGWTVDRLIEGWQAKGARLFGIREYYSIIHWDHDLPGRPKAGNPEALRSSILHFNEGGAHYMNAENSENWAPSGLGYYVASRLLWDVHEGAQLDKILDDFFDKCFGPAQAPMRLFYADIDGRNKPLMSEDLIGRMYRHLDAARKLTNDPAILKRIDDLALYVRYVDLYFQYTQSSGEARQANVEAVIRHAYRIRRTYMVHSMAIYRTHFRDHGITIPKEADWRVDAAKNPWKQDKSYTSQEVANLIADGIARNPLLEFKAVSFSDELVPPTLLKLPVIKADMPPAQQSRGVQNYYTWMPAGGGKLKVKITGGLLYGNTRGDVQVTLTPLDQEEPEPVDKTTVKPDGEPHDVELATTHSGLHLLSLSDRMASSKVEWVDGQPMTSALTFASRFDSGVQTMYFYVPKGTPLIGGYNSGLRGVIRGSEGKAVYTFTGKTGYFTVPVPAAMDGKIWSYRVDSLNKRQLMLMTVPPYVARNPQELLLPKEVVARDGGG